MISNENLKHLPDPRTLLGDRLFGDLQNLMIDVHRRGGSALRQDEHPALVFDGRDGTAIKVDRDLTRIISD